MTLIPRLPLARYRLAFGAADDLQARSVRRLVLHEEPPRSAAGLLGGFRLYQGERDTPAGPWPLRFVAAYVPRLNEGEVGHPLYARLSEEAQEAAAGDPKTFEHLAQDALELDRDGSPLGKPFLAVLKADVDRLGFLFGFGLHDPGDPGRTAPPSVVTPPSRACWICSLPATCRNDCAMTIPTPTPSMPAAMTCC